MAFRDDTEALRARVRMLESDLAEAHEQLEELGEARAEAERLRERVRTLEEELEKLRPAPEPPKPRAAPARAAGRAKQGRPAWIAVTAGVLVLAGVAWALSDSTGDLGLGGIDTDGAPTAGMIVLSEHPSPPPLTGQVTGENAASELDSTCRGYFPEQPLLVLRTSGPTGVGIGTVSSSDTVLLVVDAEGRVHCDDDSGGSSNAALAQVLGPGDHRVWVGTYQENATASFQLVVVGHATTAMPDETGIASEGEPTAGTIDPHEDSSSHTLSGTASGFVAASRVSAGCAGSLPVAPHALLRLSEPRIVRLRTRSSSDLVMLVRSAGGTVRCDDDSAGSQQPLVAAALPAGVHRVWVGVFRGSEQIPFELDVTTQLLSMPVDERGLATRSEPRLGRVALDAQPSYSISETARGVLPTRPIAAECGAFVQPEPDLQLDLESARDVTLTTTTSAGPLELLVQRPDGTFTCTRGAVRESWGPGAHRVWLGVTAVDGEAPFTLTATSEPPSVTPFRP